MSRKIIVLTPIKNEAWILTRFLEVTSSFADHILIADQNSTDISKKIYEQYPKVVVIENRGTSYSESERQMLLIKSARELFGKENILLALDADEILTANSLDSTSWNQMLKAESGTVLYFEKPTLYQTTEKVMRYEFEGWPLGYVDDGAEHKPKVIHSTRVPSPDYAKHLYLHGIKFLHYALLRPMAQSSKVRMYSVLECINKTKPIYLRRKIYSPNFNHATHGSRIEELREDWIKKWEESGIDMKTVEDTKYHWYDLEVLKLFKIYGEKKFYSEDIWAFNWENYRNYARENGEKGIPENPIRPPSWIYTTIVNNIYIVVNKIRNISR